ncbi:MAG: VCBS repeat-containing protein, partial [Myxococcota bacterium]
HSNRTNFNPPSHNHLMTLMRPLSEMSFERTFYGDFTGDGQTDVVVQAGRSLVVYESAPDGLRFVGVTAGALTGPGGDASLMHRGRVLIGNFDSDPNDELIVISRSRNTRIAITIDFANGAFTTKHIATGGFVGPNSYQPIGSNDRYLVLDYDGDGIDDVAAINLTDFRTEAFTIYRTLPNGGFTTAVAYFTHLPRWRMAPGDQFQAGDFDKDGKDDILVTNTKNWRRGWIGTFLSNGRTLKIYTRNADSFVNWNKLTDGDRFHVGDFNGDGMQDIAITNVARNYWCCDYLATMMSTGSGFARSVKYQNSVPGWNIATGDQYIVANVDGDRDDDLVVYNPTHWRSEFLGILQSQGNGRYQRRGFSEDRVGRWNLHRNDQFSVVRIDNNAREDLVVYNANWLGVLRSDGTRFTQSQIHFEYLADYEYHRSGWW